MKRGEKNGNEEKIIAEEAAQIKEYRKRVKDKYLDRRLHAIQLLGEGMRAKEIAEKLDADKRQIRACIHRK